MRSGSARVIRYLGIACLGALGACESRGEKESRLRGDVEISCMVLLRETQERLDSAFGHWMTTYPDTLMAVMAAYGDSLEQAKARCDAATREYQRFMRRD